LVLDGAEVIGGVPVDIVGNSGVFVGEGGSFRFFFLLDESEVGGDEFFVGEIGELVQSVDDSGVFGVFRFNESFGFKEDGKSGHFFFDG
jgi:hypothetical protein